MSEAGWVTGDDKAGRTNIGGWLGFSERKEYRQEWAIRICPILLIPGMVFSESVLPGLSPTLIKRLLEILWKDVGTFFFFF